MRVAVTQANYIPWLGYFDLLDQVDLWVSLDDVQLTKRSFIVRNRIKLANGQPRWLTVALERAARETEIRGSRLAPGDWSEDHLNVLRQNYRGAPFSASLEPWLEELLTPAGDAQTLADHNQRIVLKVAESLGIEVEVRRASEVCPAHEHSAGLTPQERMVEILTAVGGTSLWNFQRGVEIGLYDAASLASQGFTLMKQEYEHPTYPQLGDEFLPYMSVLDLLLNVGTADALEVVRSGSRWLGG